MIASSLNDVLSTILIIRTLVVVCLFPTAVIFASPFLVGLASYILNQITFGYDLVSIAGTIAMTFAGRTFISIYAPSIKHRDDAFRKSSVALPALAFAFFQVLLHFVLLPLSSAAGMKHYLTSKTPSLPYFYTFQVSVSAFLLGFSIVIRYFGLASIMRCSAFPLISRPITAAVQSFAARCQSGDAFLALIASPSDTPGLLIGSPFNTKDIDMGRRYQGPVLQSSVLLVLSSFTLTGTAAFALSHNFASNAGSIMLLTTCSMSMFLHIMFTCLDGQSHELNPLSYRNIRLASFVSHPIAHQYLKSCICSAIVSPATLFLGNASWEMRYLAYSVVMSVVANVYLSAIDFMSRWYLCAYRYRLQRLISEVTNDISPELTTEVIVKSLLFDSTNLFDSIMKPTSKLGANQMEEEELSRSKEDTDKLASVLTQKVPDSGLGEDLLRATILESFGGKDPTSKSHLGASSGHNQTVKSLVAGVGLVRGTSEPLAAPIVRALCAYVAGLGVALQKNGQPPNPKQPRLLTPAAFVTWSLPPGALNCAERAIIGVTRCVVYSITSSGTAMDWRSTKLSMFVPVVFVAAFQLRCGLQSYDKQGPNSTTHLLQVLNTCDACALYMLEALQKMDTRTVELTIRQKDCRAWLEKLMSETSATPPVLILENDKSIPRYNKNALALKYY